MRDATQYISEAWSANTHKRYSSAWKRWCGWCTEQEVNQVNAHFSLIINFLSSIASSGMAYRTVNNFWSAGHDPLDGKPVGEHPLVCKVLRVIRMADLLARNTVLWYVSIVLRFLESSNIISTYASVNVALCQKTNSHPDPQF